ncbi:antitoxin [Gephyromycinifex aptenodytis]|uniref:antitoxin n=1 Tax=Gephyromycinifex aptenodytis TaxID=2716227 RepID=UPI0014480EF3|nr:antitoxin [Gephyromycinifex aptenodytis]
MGHFDGLKDKASELKEQHGDKIESASDQAIQKVGGAVDERTGGEHADKIKQATDKADEYVGDNSQ